MTYASKKKSPALYDQRGFLLRRAHQLAVSIFEAQLEHLRATPAQIAVLTMLRDHPSLYQSELARAIGLDKATVSVLVKAMEARGLLQRRPSSSNSKRIAVTLTTQGESMVARSRVPCRKADELLMSPLKTEERDQLVALLRRLVAELERHARAPLARQTARTGIESCRLPT